MFLPGATNVVFRRGALIFPFSGSLIRPYTRHVKAVPTFVDHESKAVVLKTAGEYIRNLRGELTDDAN